MQLRKFFPTSKEGAALYNGFMYDKWHFGRVFKIESSFEKTLEEVSKFLVENGYGPVSAEDLDEEHSYESDDTLVKVWPNPYQRDEVIMVVVRDIESLEVPDLLMKQLQLFRDNRDWTQFHDSKNLATAISIEAAELNELFLWKSIDESETVDRDKIKEELADIFAYSLLLAAKYGFDLESIVLDKVKMNGEKYPVHKAKGTSKKYDEL